MAVTGIKENAVIQIGLIVRDVEQTAAHYARIFGLPMPEFITSGTYAETQATYKGKPTDARVKLVCFQMGAVQYEILQPLGEPSAWKDFLDQRGEGIHHIAFPVSPSDIPAASFAEHGYPIIQQGNFTGGMYTYVDTERDLGVALELLEHFNGGPTPSAPFPADKGIGTDLVCQVGIIVHNIERAVQHYGDVLGMPTPHIFSTPGYDKVKTTYKGQPCDGVAKLAFFDAGQLQIELIEPDDVPSVWRDFLNEKGEGAQHIAFQIKDTKRVTDYFAQHGIEIAQQGMYGDLSGMYTYLASDAALGTTVELLESF